MRHQAHVQQTGAVPNVVFVPHGCAYHEIPATDAQMILGSDIANK
jgi:hypothetical protein